MAKLSKLYTVKQINELRNTLIALHGNHCAICKKPREAFKKNLSVDHAHKTGLIRGLLCFHDNRYVVGKFDIPKACKLMTYLVEFDDVHNNKEVLRELYNLIGEKLK